jgi:hypothetical protein
MHKERVAAIARVANKERQTMLSMCGFVAASSRSCRTSGSPSILVSAPNNCECSRTH